MGAPSNAITGVHGNHRSTFGVHDRFQCPKVLPKSDLFRHPPTLPRLGKGKTARNQVIYRRTP